MSATEPLVDAFVAAYPRWVAERLSEHGIARPPGYERAMEEGERWLATELADLLALPAVSQPRSPLEVFQEAMRFPTEALVAAGAVPVVRDEAAVRALPGDSYDLAPASSQPLGEAAWRAHLAWGTAKAGALAGAVAAAPRTEVAYVGNNLMDRSSIDGAAARAGLRVAVFATGADFESGLLDSRPPLVALVDLTVADSDDAIKVGAAAGVKVIGFGPHVDDWALDRARSLGADQALPRSRFFRTLDGLLPKRV